MCTLPRISENNINCAVITFLPNFNLYQQNFENTVNEGIIRFDVL